MLRRGVLTAGLCLLCLGAAAAGAATRERATFTVTLTATLTKTWNVVETVNRDCDEVTTSSGSWQVTLRTTRATRITAVAPARRGQPIRFSPPLVRRIAGTTTQSGSQTSQLRGPGCARPPREQDCARQRRTFSGAAARLTSPRAGQARLGRLTGGSAGRAVRTACPAPDEVRSARTDLDLAGAPLDTRDVFARDVPRFFISGNTEQVTTLEGAAEGHVTERVRWTLTFTRVSR